MATEADTPEGPGPEPIYVMKIKEETKELDCSHLNTMVSKASSLGELQEAGNGHCSLTSETVEKSMNTEDSDVVSQSFNHHILEGKVGSIEGETFLKSTAVANGASDESIQGSEICEDREKLALVQKEDVMTNKDVEETHDIIAMNTIVALYEHDTSMNLENAKFEDGKEIPHPSKLPSEVNMTEVCTAENYLSIPNITSNSLDQSVQEEKIEGREGETIVEEEKQSSEESYDDRRTLLEETDKEEIWQHQHVESPAAESYEQTSAVAEEVPAVSQKDESEGKTEDPSFELRQQVGQTVEATPDHIESFKILEVRKDEITGLVTLVNGEDKEKNCDSDNIPIKQNVVYDYVTQTSEQEEAILLKAESEEKDKLECASSQALKDIKEAEKPCQEEVPIGHETADANEYTDKQIIQEDLATKYQPSTVSFGEEMVQSCQVDEEVEIKQDAEVPMGIEVDRATKNSTEKFIAENEAVEDHCEASSTGAEKVPKDNQEKEKEANKPEEEDPTGTQTTIAVEDIQEDTFENNDAVTDHCIESDREKSTNMNSHEDLEVPEELEAGVARKNIAEKITEETEAVEDYSEPSTGEETMQMANQEDENEAEESKKEDCSGTHTIIAYEDTQEHAFHNNNAANGHCTESEGGKTVNVEENPGEDLEGNMPEVEVLGELETEAATTASENTSKKILKDEVATPLLPASVGEETTKAIHTKDEGSLNAHEKEGAEDGMTTAEQNVQEDIIATELPAISLLEKIIRNSCQDEACSKEPETSGTNDNAVKEYVEVDGAITDICAMEIGEGTTVENSHEEKKKVKPEGKDKEPDLNSEALNCKTMNCASDRDLVNLEIEEEPNSYPIGYVDTEVSGEEIQKDWNEKLVDSSSGSEVSDEHIENEIAVKNGSNDDELKTNVSVNQNMSSNEAGPEGVKIIDTSDLPSVEASPIPIEANETSLEAPRVEELKLGENSSLDEKTDKEILERETADENRARDEIKYYMTHGASNVLVPEYKDHGAEPIPGTEAASVEIPLTIESETLQEASILSSGQLDPESTEANMTIKEDTPPEYQIQDEVQETPIERTIEENFMQNEDSIDVNLETKETISNERTVEDEILKPRDEEVLQQSLQKDESEVDNQETCVDLMSKGLDTVDSSANDEKYISVKIEGGEENLNESVEEDTQNGELSGIDQTRSQTALQEEEGNLVDQASMQQNLRTADSCEMIQNEETDTLQKDEDDTSVPDLKPKENDHEEAQSIEATEEIKSTENETLHHEKADGLVESVERECGKLESIDPAEKVRDASATTAEDQSVVTSIETEKGQITMDQHTGSLENHIIVQNTQEEDMEAEIFGEIRPSLKTEETDPHVNFDAEKVIQEVQRADKSEEIEKQITEEDVAAELYLLYTSAEAVKKVQDTDIIGNEHNLEVKESNGKKEIATVQDEENPNSKPDAASMTEESEEEKPKKVVDDELSETFTLVFEVLKENNQETTEDLPDMTETESAFMATEEKSSHPVESECEKIILPTGICSEEKTLEPVETIAPVIKDEVESANLEEKSELMSEPPSPLISETREENCEETTEETSLQKVEPEGEKSVLPSGMGSVEKSLEIVETEAILVDEDINNVKFEEKYGLISQFSCTGDGNGTQEKSIEKLDRNKFEEEIKEVVPASDALSGSEGHREEAISQFDNAAEKTEENLQEYSALVSQSQELGTLKDNPTIIDASEVKHNPEIESTVCQNVEADKEDAHEIQLTAVDEVLKDEDQREAETQDKNVDTLIATEITEGTHPHKEDEWKELKVSPMELEDVNETPNVESMKETEKLEISPAFALGENVSELKNGLVVDSGEPTKLTEPEENCEENLKERRTSESEAWKKKLENNELEECFSRVEEETETVGASEDPHKDVTDNNGQVKNQEEKSTDDLQDDTTMGANPNEENSEILVNLGEKIGSLEVKNTTNNEEDSAKMNPSIEDKLVGEVGGECNEASNPEPEIPQKTLEFVSEAQTRDVLLETKRTENDEDTKDIVPVGDGNIGEISLVEIMGKEHLMEEKKIKERGETEYLNKKIAQEVSARLENSGTSESSEKQIQGEEGCVKVPYPISVGKDTVTESRQEAHTGETFMETHMKLEPAESGFEPIADPIANSNDTTEITMNGTLIEENQGLENGNANENTEMLITKEEEASKIILEEMDKEMTVPTETREIVPAKTEEGPDMNLHEKHTTSAPCEAEPTENMPAMVVKSSSLELEEATTTNSETTISATEDARGVNNLSEDGNLLSTPFELISKRIETTEAFPSNDQNVATMIDASVVDESLADDIPDKEERAKEREGEHIDTRAITAVCPPPEEVEHVKNGAPEENILKEGVKKLEEFNIQEISRESKDTQIQIPQQEETQVFLAAEHETAEESVTASTGKINNTSESFVEDQGQMKTDPKHEAKVCESETIESSEPEDIVKPGPEGLPADQPSVMETIVKETTANLEECNGIPQNSEKISEASDRTNEEKRSREVYLSHDTEANTPTLLEDQSGSTLEENNIEEQKPRTISEINGKPKEAECGQYKESISETEPSLPDLTLDSEIETSIDKKEPLESKVPLTVQVEKDAKEEGKHSADEEEDEHIKEDSGSDAPVMVEASADVDVKPAHKKSHNILSGVGSKVKHSIAKVKKAITGKSSSHKASSPKQENGSAATA